MAILALDTSAAIAVAVLDDAGRTLAARGHDTARHHAELLAPTIADALAAAGLDAGDVRRVVVGTGPGPFTGLRAGLVTARAFARATGATLLGVSSLDALAAQAADALALQPGSDVVVATDARRREVYWARYTVVSRGGAAQDGAVARVDLVAGPDVGAADALVASGALDGAVVTGRGVHLYPVLATAGPGALEAAGAGADAGVAVAGRTGVDLPDPAVLARLGIARQALGEDLPTEPLYLRRPDVQAAAGRKRVLG